MAMHPRRRRVHASCRLQLLLMAAALSPELVASTAYAQSSFTWRARATDEATAAQPNRSSVFAAPAVSDAWSGSNELILSADNTWKLGERLKIGASIDLQAASDGDVRLRARDAYARVSVLSWLDVEAGKRLLRWGTGYAFTPTGQLDPPRTPTDPQDHLGVNEGMVLVRADAFRGATAVTIAAAAPRLDRPATMMPGTPRRLLALRVRTTIAGVEVAGVASAADHRRLSWGGNLTHVVGRQLEYHGELLVHDDASGWRRALAPDEPTPRRVSALVGLQYTTEWGLNVIGEYYRDGNGLSAALWSRLSNGAEQQRMANTLDVSSESTGPAESAGSALAGADHSIGPIASAAPSQLSAATLGRPTRRNFLFVRGSRANTGALISPELIAIVSFDDRGVTFVPTLTIAPSRHVQLYVRGVVLTGPARSADGSAPTSTTVSAGLRVLF